MKRLARSARVLLFLALVSAGLLRAGATAALAQSTATGADAYTSELTGMEIAISGDEFEIYDGSTETYASGEGEIVQIASTTAYAQIAFYDDTDTNLETLEIYNEAFSGDVDTFEVLDEGDDAGTVSSFAVATYNDVDYLYYISVTEDVVGNVDVLQRIYAPDTTFVDDLEAAQEAITLDGAGFLEDVDAADLAELAGVTPGGPAGETPTETTTRQTGETADSYAFDLVPAELKVSGDVAIDETMYEAPVIEQVSLAIDGADTLAIAQFMQNPMDAEATLDIILGNFQSSFDLENLGSDADDTSAWSLDVGDVEGQEAVIFIYVDSSRYDGFHYVEVLLASEPDFPDALDTLGESVTVDGEPMFGTAPLDAVNALMNGEEIPVETTTRDSGTDDPDGGERSRANDRRIDAKIGEGDDGNGQADDAGALDLESQGLVSETEFESPQYGVSVEWDEEAWAADPSWEMTAVSDTESGVDSVVLFGLDTTSYLMIQIMEGDGTAPADLIDMWESGEFIADSIGDGAEVLLTDSGRGSAGVVYLVPDEDEGDLVYVQEAIELDDGGTLAIVTMMAPVDDVAAAYGDAQDLVTINGDGAAATFSPRDVEDAVEP